MPSLVLCVTYTGLSKVESVRFIDNVAKVFGGAIWVDTTSSSEVYIELLNDISEITTSAGCFIELSPSLQFNYGGSNPSAKVRISLILLYLLVFSAT